MTTIEEQRKEVRDKLRLFLQDHPTMNKLLNDYELSDKKIDLAIELTVDDYNITMPILTAVNVTTFPNIGLLIHGAAIEALTMAGILYSRNRLSYSSGGVTVAVADKASEYMAWINRFVNKYETNKLGIKKHVNISGCYGGIHSEYYQGDERRLYDDY